jgi:hypothetical protein
VPEAVHQEIARRAENKAPKMIADYKRKLKPQKPSAENPEDWFGKRGLNKAKEDVKVHPAQRKQFRQERRSFEGHDPLAQEAGKKGVSNIGIETRRADPKQKGVFSHGYARVGDPEWHGQRAKKYHQELLSGLKQQPKPKLQKANPEAPKVNLNPEHGKIIANAYENMKHQPNHPQVKAAYNALINETKDQFKDMLNRGIKISKMKPNQENPYPTSKHLHADLDKGHMWLFPTELGFGSETDMPKDHPMLQPTEFMHEGKPLLANDIFRLVHDSIHHKLRNGFGPKGEHESFLEHKKMYSPLAQKALATETMAQNSYVNFSNKIGHLNQKKPGSAYAPQKAGLLSDNIINGKWHE